jgi:hypothetical protein
VKHARARPKGALLGALRTMKTDPEEAAAHAVFL